MESAYRGGCMWQCRDEPTEGGRKQIEEGMEYMEGGVCGGAGTESVLEETQRPYQRSWRRDS